MPIEIRELVIKAIVDPNAENRTDAGTAKPSAKSADMIIKRSVEQTLNILEKKRDR